MNHRTNSPKQWLAGLGAVAALLLPSSSAWASEGAGNTGALSGISELWVLVCAALVFLMQAGFLAFEVGLVRQKNATITALKNVADFAVVGLCFVIIGFTVMFGTSRAGWVGQDLFLLATTVFPEAEGGATHLGWAFVLFQIAFCGTAMTVVSGAVAERTGLTAYLVFGVVMATIIYPLYGHWVWGGLFLGPENEGWLAALGFRDFAGSSVVHGIGAWSALAAIMVVGPRMGRYTTDGKLNPMSSHGMHWSALGVLMLWFCWWGFNGGSRLELNKDVPLIILNTNLSGASAAMVGLVHGNLAQGRRHMEEKVLGCALAGLVAITACCDIVPPWAALLVGAGAAVVHNIAFELVLIRWRLDDVVGAVPVHGFAGVWGCLCVGLFGNSEVLGDNSRLEQIGVQLLGCVVCFAWAFGVSWLCFTVLRSLVGIRVDPYRELQGLTLSATEDSGAAEEEAEAEGEPEYDELLAQIREQFDADERFDRY